MNNVRRQNTVRHFAQLGGGDDAAQAAIVAEARLQPQPQPQPQPPVECDDESGSQVQIISRKYFLQVLQAAVLAMTLFTLMGIRSDVKRLLKRFELEDLSRMVRR